MKNTNKKKLLYLFTGLMTITFLFWSHDALSAESSGHWRYTYDRIMMCINFTILAFLLIKFAKKPISNILQGQKEKIERQIKQIEDEKLIETDKVRENRRILNQSDEFLQQLKERIISQGKRKKNRIINDAKLESRLILEEAQLRINHQIDLARERLKAELVDRAVDMALEKLPKIITQEDDQKVIQAYLNSISQH